MNETKTKHLDRTAGSSAGSTSSWNEPVSQNRWNNRPPFQRTDVQMPTTLPADFDDEEPTLKVNNVPMAEMVTQPPPPRTRTRPYPVVKSAGPTVVVK